MKRKRGKKKGKPKKTPSEDATEACINVVSVNTEDNSGLDDFENVEYESGMEVETPSSTGTDKPDKLANINPDGSVEKRMVQAVYGRVKLKLKASKVVESRATSSDAVMPSDTDKSSQQTGLDKQGVFAEKTDDSANSLPEMKVAPSGNLSKKSGSIKIKSSGGLGSSSTNQTSMIVLEQDEKAQQKELKLPHQEPRYNKQELDDALTVIKKVMKMDAAEPFNVPVNPITLGIPDYFDVIDTPMDFGTICSNLENGVKYINSEDVFKDVQYIWGNCYKYNKKGDYIVDLMKRVKKNFMKYWTAAGLYSEPPQKINGVEGNQGEDVAPSSQGKVQMKHKKGKRHGKRHKDGCLCAICVLKRRRKEREANARIIEGQSKTGESNLAPEFKQEETSPVESPGGEDTSSDMDNSLDPESGADDLEDKVEELKSEAINQGFSPHGEKQAEEMDPQIIGVEETQEQSQLGDRYCEEPYGQCQTQALEEAGAGNQTDFQKGEMVQNKEETTADQQQKLKDSQEKHKKARLHHNLSRFDNPVVLRLCETLFPENRTSVWTGPHSLVHQQVSAPKTSIHAAIETLMK